MQNLTVKLHDVVEDGLPDMDKLVGRVAFLFDGCIVSGWPLEKVADENADAYPSIWEANDDVGHGRMMGGIRKWMEFEQPIHALQKLPPRHLLDGTLILRSLPVWHTNGGHLIAAEQFGGPQDEAPAHVTAICGQVIANVGEKDWCTVAEDRRQLVSSNRPLSAAALVPCRECLLAYQQK